MRGFKTPKTPYATIKGFEVTRVLRMGQAGMFTIQSGSVGEARTVEPAFDIGSCALTEVMELLQKGLTNPKPKVDTCPHLTTSPIHQVCNRARQALGHRSWRSAFRRPRHPAGRSGQSDGEVYNARREWTSIGYMNYVRQK